MERAAGTRPKAAGKSGWRAGKAGIACLSGLLLMAAALPAGAAGTDRKTTHKLTEPDRIAILRNLIAQTGFSRFNLPRGKHVVHLTAAGRVLNLKKIEQGVRNDGIAIPRGGRVQITAVHFHSHSIDFDLNGGPHTTHWYNHIQFGIGNGPMNSIPDRGRQGGGRIELRFRGPVPGLSSAELRKALSPMIEWNLRAGPALTSYHMPPRVKKAISAHHVLVGMNRIMVIAALGRTQRKYHEQNLKTGEVYTDWVYGNPPAKTTFVRLEGNRVVRVVTYYPDGHKIIRNRPEVLIVSRQNAAAASSTAADNGPRPTLRSKPTYNQPGSNPLPMPQHPIVTTPPLGSGPNNPSATSTNPNTPTSAGGIPH